VDERQKKRDGVDDFMSRLAIFFVKGQKNWKPQ
jgi:hypothetical protein